MSYRLLALHLIAVNHFLKPSASKVTELSTAYSNGEKVLLKYGKQVTVQRPELCMKELIEMLKTDQDEGRTPVPIVHN